MEPLLTIDQVSARLRVHPSTVRRLVRRGELPVVRLTDRTHRYRVADVDALLAKAGA